MTTKKEMARLIEQMADTPETTQWLRERNEAMRRSLRDISLSAVQYDAAGGRREDSIFIFLYDSHSCGQNHRGDASGNVWNRGNLRMHLSFSLF